MINRDYYLKQHKTVEYLGYYLDSDLNRESMAHRILKKINTKPKSVIETKQLFELIV